MSKTKKIIKIFVRDEDVPKTLPYLFKIMVLLQKYKYAILYKTIRLKL